MRQRGTVSPLASDYTRLNSFLRRAGYYDTQSATARDLFCDADDALFHKILYNKAYPLHMYLPDRSQIVYTLRNRNHNKILIPKTSDLNERHFLTLLLLLTIICTPLSSPLCEVAFGNFLLQNFMMMMMMMNVLSQQNVCQKYQNRFMCIEVSVLP